MMPKSIEKFLVDCWAYSKEEVREVGISNEYVAWYCGIDHIVDMAKMPESMKIIKDFETYSFNSSYKKDNNVFINFDDIKFFYYYISHFIEKYYDNKPFEARIIRVENGFYYLEFKLDDKYSFVYQQVYVLTEEEQKELDLIITDEKEDINLDFNKVFTKLTIGDDMIL